MSICMLDVIIFFLLKFYIYNTSRGVENRNVGSFFFSAFLFSCPRLGLFVLGALKCTFSYLFDVKLGWCFPFLTPFDKLRIGTSPDFFFFRVTFLMASVGDRSNALKFWHLPRCRLFSVGKLKGFLNIERPR